MSRDRFAGYPSAVAYEEPDGKKAVQHLLWGTFVRDQDERRGDYAVKDVHGVAVSGRYARVHVRGRRQDAWIREHELQDERLLEVIFVDIGQGDGSLVITPDDRAMVIDAGDGDNMHRFLRWRFGRFTRPFRFHAGVITHPDADHYRGFEHLFADPNVSFETLYHNGIMERFGADGLGPKSRVANRSYLTELVTSKDELEAFLGHEPHWRHVRANGRVSHKQYPEMLKQALDQDRFGAFRMLSVRDRFMPGFEADQPLSIEVLGPVTEPLEGDPPRLRWLSSVGKTKNGHSVVLKLRYRDVSVLLGGDLNIPSEHLLLAHHTGMASPAANREDELALVEAARRVFQVDIAKSCHHGSSDFSPLFLRALNPIATVISSGDDEPHSHPRADTLGAVGAYSRGGRPLIFSTELARSAPELIKHPRIVRRELAAGLRAILDAPAGTERQLEARNRKAAQFQASMDRVIDRSVAVFGAINVVTDGRKVVIAQKLERPRSQAKKWDIYRLEPQGNGPLQFQSQH